MSPDNDTKLDKEDIPIGIIHPKLGIGCTMSVCKMPCVQECTYR